MRESSYIAITVMLLYVGNLTYKELSERRLIKQLSFFFVTVTIGGVLGLLFPSVSFTSLVEVFVPGSISHVPYVARLIHPAFAQVQDFGGDLLPRPSAPFAYTNSWASSLSMLGIWFGVGWVVVFSKTQRLLGVVVVIVAGVTLLYSLNRGAWAGVVLGVLFVVLVLALRGHLLPLVGVLIAVVVASQIFLNSPLKQVYENRANNSVSNGIRLFTTQKALELSAQSPVIGFGSTRAAVGSKSSIAIGKTPQCPTCGNISIGINGNFFTLLVATGWGGTLLFFGFWVGQAWRSRRDMSVVGIACQLTLLTAFFYGFFYNIELVVPFLVLALMWRRRAASGGNGDREQASSPGPRSRPVIYPVICLVICLLAGCGPTHREPVADPGKAGALFGAFVSSTYTDPARIAAVEDFEATLGRNWTSCTPTTSGRTPSRPEIDRYVADRGDILLLSWAGTTPSEIVDGRYDSMIRQRAKALAKLGTPIMLRWRWEMNRPNLRSEILPRAGTSRPGSTSAPSSPRSGTDNVDWVWCPSANGFEETEGAKYYPGDDEVEWLCADAYTPYPNTPLEEVLAPFLDWAGSEAPDVPVMIGEFGTRQGEPGARAAWLDDAMRYFRSSTQVEAVIVLRVGHRGGRAVRRRRRAFGARDDAQVGQDRVAEPGVVARPVAAMRLSARRRRSGGW